MIHVVKIQKKYADRIIDATKTFEVRYNDRDYQVGDYLHFKVLTETGYGIDTTHMLNDSEWRIVYVHSGLGMEKGYVVLGIEPYVQKFWRSY